MKRRASRLKHTRQASVIDDLGFSPEQAAALKFKAQLYQAILKYSEKYSRRELQLILGEPQPRVSELLNGKIANKSIDKLLYYAGRLEIETRLNSCGRTKKSSIRRLRKATRQPSEGS
jgi:predicted XRE-type DNA-binding protein